MAAARRPPSSEPAKVQFFLPTTTARSSRSAALFDMQRTQPRDSGFQTSVPTIRDNNLLIDGGRGAAAPLPTYAFDALAILCSKWPVS